MRKSYQVKKFMRRRDRARPCPQQTNENKIIIGCYQIEKQMKIKAPSDEGAVDFRRKMTEGEKAINIKFAFYSVGRWLAAAVKSQRISGYKTVIFLYYIVGANCVRPFFVCYEFTGDRISASLV